MKKDKKIQKMNWFYCYKQYFIYVVGRGWKFIYKVSYILFFKEFIYYIVGVFVDIY